MPTALAHPLQRRFDFALRTPRTAAPAGWIRRDDVAMGAAVRVELWADDARAGEAAAQAVIDEMRRIDRAWNPHKAGSELGRINREAGRRAVPLSEEGFRLVERALALAELTEGGFDLGNAAAPAAAPGLPGWRGLELDRRARTLRFAREGMCLDLGGLPRGHAVDNAALLLARRGVRHARVDAGGHCRVIGHRRGSPWMLTLRDPCRGDAEPVAVLPLADTAVALHEGGTHRVVAVLGADGPGCAALCQALLARGPAEGLALLARVPGLQAVVVDAGGRVHRSAGLGSALP